MASGGAGLRVGHPMEAGTPHARRCTAHSKRTGEPCKNAAVVGRSVCRMHGGQSLAGPASSTFKHGTFSKYLPKRLRERYHHALGDPNLLRQWDAIALVDSLVVDAIKTLDTGESGELWSRLQGAWADFEKARTSKNRDALLAPILQLGDLIKRGAGEREARLELLSLLDQRRKLTESERKLLVEQKQMMSAEEAMTMAYAIAGIVKEEVEDATTRARVASRIMGLLNAPGGGTAECETD